MRKIDKNINMKKVNLLAEERYNNLKGLITEGNEPFRVYHKSYGSAIDAIGDYAASLGFELDMEEYRNTYLDAFLNLNLVKPSVTHLVCISLVRNRVKCYTYRYITWVSLELLS